MCVIIGFLSVIFSALLLGAPAGFLFLVEIEGFEHSGVRTGLAWKGGAEVAVYEMENVCRLHFVWICSKTCLYAIQKHFFDGLTRGPFGTHKQVGVFRFISAYSRHEFISDMPHTFREDG